MGFCNSLGFEPPSCVSDFSTFQVLVRCSFHFRPRECRILLTLPVCLAVVGQMPSQAHLFTVMVVLCYGIHCGPQLWQQCSSSLDWFAPAPFPVLVFQLQRFYELPGITSSLLCIIIMMYYAYCIVVGPVEITRASDTSKVNRNSLGERVTWFWPLELVFEGTT